MGTRRQRSRTARLGCTIHVSFDHWSPVPSGPLFGVPSAFTSSGNSPLCGLLATLHGKDVDSVQKVRRVEGLHVKHLEGMLQIAGLESLRLAEGAADMNLDASYQKYFRLLRLPKVPALSVQYETRLVKIHF